MSSPAKNEMDVDAFLAWAEGRDGRWELRDGQPVMMAPERAAHALTKFAAQKCSEGGRIERAGLPCRVFPDGMTVRITARTAFEPDALVVCPPPTDLNTMEIPNPVVVVEVFSPEHRGRRSWGEARRLFFVRSVEHYLIIDADRRIMIHHKRGPGGAIETRILRDGRSGSTRPASKPKSRRSSWRSDAGPRGLNLPAILNQIFESRPISGEWR